MVDFLIRRSNSLSKPGSMGAIRREAAPSSGASMSVLPDVAKVIFRGRPPTIPKAESAFGITLPRDACRFTTMGDLTAYWLGPDEWMLQVAGEDPAHLMDRLQRALAGQLYSIVDVSHRSDAFAISGPSSEYVLNHACPLDLSEAAFPVGACTRTILGKATIIISRTAPQTFHIDVWRSFAVYTWDFLNEARSELSAVQEC
jgi:sarcosine oxidase, subunit gamma